MRRFRSILIMAFIFMGYGLYGTVGMGETFYVNRTCGDDSWSGTEPNCVGLNGPKVKIQAGNLHEHKGGR